MHKAFSILLEKVIIFKSAKSDTIKILSIKFNQVMYSKCILFKKSNAVLFAVVTLIPLKVFDRKVPTRV